MKTRILTAAVGIPLVLLALFWPGGRPWFWFVIALIAVGYYEFTACLRAVRGFGKRLALGLFGLVYIGGLMSFLIAIRRRLPWTRGPWDSDLAAWLVFCVLGVIWAGDSAAYFIGRNWGRHKCAPKISPNKTWEGVVAGLAASTIVGYLLLAAIPGFAGVERNSLPLSLFGLAVGGAGQVGDLFESAIKRKIGVKDFGALLPGHGGVLDRFDSLMFAAPVAYFLLVTLFRL